MAKARPRHIVTGKIAFNDVAITGQRVIELGPCNGLGNTKSSAGKKLRKKELTHTRFRFEDKAWVRENKLKAFYEFHLSHDSVLRFTAPAEM